MLASGSSEQQNIFIFTNLFVRSSFVFFRFFSRLLFSRLSFYNNNLMNLIVCEKMCDGNLIIVFNDASAPTSATVSRIRDFRNYLCIILLYYIHVNGL